ncbi:MAG TPA: hypothetical protein VM513_06045 [Kofleriaceae bacterium]|jgi:hypothetical protein|nr:hypothetical protein [Kofleriaceae bacterium]
MRFAKLWVMVALLGGCGDNLPGLSVEEYAAAVRDADCRRLARCGMMPDLATCERTNLGRYYTSPWFLAAVADGTITWHPELAYACIEELAERSCERDLYRGTTSLACATMYEGTLGDGEACTFDSECISRECWFGEAEEACWAGTCTGHVAPTPARLGEDCGNAPCIEGYCGNDYRCTPYRLRGETCGENAICGAGLMCRFDVCRRIPDTGEPCADTCLQYRDTCGSAYECRPRAADGQSCAWDADCGYWSRCDSTTMRCVPNSARVGDACMSDDDCGELGTVCAFNDGFLYEGICTWPRQNGESCQRNAECESLDCDSASVGSVGSCASPDTCR